VGHFAAYWTADSAFAAGRSVLVSDAAAPELLPDFVPRQHRTAEPARRDEQSRVAVQDRARAEIGAGFRGRCGLGNRRQREQTPRQTLAPRRRRRLARSGEKPPAKGRFREAGAVPRNVCVRRKKPLADVPATAALVRGGSLFSARDSGIVEGQIEARGAAWTAHQRAGIVPRLWLEPGREGGRNPLSIAMGG